MTPLSNNGEETSFPVANKLNPLGSIDEVLAIDAIAAAVNAGRVVDIPNGTGFCLYVTRECLDAVGSLSEDFYRGYVEDVDFCFTPVQRASAMSARHPSMSATPAVNRLVAKNGRWWLAIMRYWIVGIRPIKRNWRPSIWLTRLHRRAKPLSAPCDHRERARDCC